MIYIDGYLNRNNLKNRLLQIKNKTAPKQAALKTVYDKVREEWINQQRKIIDDAFYNSLRNRYEIIIEDYNLNDLTVSGK